MNKILVSLALIVLGIPHSSFAATTTFVCTSITPQSTSVTMKLVGSNTLHWAKIQEQGNISNSTQAPQTTTYQQNPTGVTNTYDFLTPGASYKTFEYDQAGIYIGEIPKCSFTTLNANGTTPPPNPGSTTPTQTTNAYRVVTSLQGASQATIKVQSLLAFDTAGKIEVKKSSDINIIASCGSTATPVQFPSGQQANPCIVPNLVPGNYLARVTGTSASGTSYGGITEFTVPPPTTTSTSPTTPTGPISGTPQTGTVTTGTPQTGTGGTFTPQTSTSTASGSASGAGGGILLDVKLQNPLKVNDIQSAIKFFVDTLIKIAIPFIVVFFIWAGLKFILAQGKPDKITEAKKMFWYTIIGTLLILGAWTITNAIIGTVNSITN